MVPIAPSSTSTRELRASSRPWQRICRYSMEMGAFPFYRDGSFSAHRDGSEPAPMAFENTCSPVKAEFLPLMARAPSLFQTVVWGFLGNDHVVNVTLAKPSARNAKEIRPLLQFGNGSATAI